MLWRLPAATRRMHKVLGQVGHKGGKSDLDSDAGVEDEFPRRRADLEERPRAQRTSEMFAAWLAHVLAQQKVYEATRLRKGKELGHLLCLETIHEYY